MSKDRPGLVYVPLNGMGDVSSSIDATPAFKSSVRLLNLSHVGMDGERRFRGTELTWDNVGALQKEFGSNPNLLYVLPQTGWLYEWNVGRKRLTVTSDSGAVTVHEGIAAFEDLLVSWDIVESYNFVVVLDANFEPDIFLVGRKSRERGTKQQTLQWGENDKYLLPPEHYTHEQIIGIDFSGRFGVVSLSAGIIKANTDADRNPLFPKKLASMSAGGSFPANILLEMLVMPVRFDRIRRNKTAHGMPSGLLLMIKMFATLTASFPDSSPWMMFAIWQWKWKYSKPPIPPRPDDPDNPISPDRIYDRVFDLSPYWG